MPQDFDYTPDDLRTMSIEDVAIAILRDVDVNNEWNAHNWITAARLGYDGPTLRILAEAWQWLFSKGAVARDYSQTASEAMFVTSLGRELVDEGPARLHAETRLGFELHPALEQRVRRQFLLGEYELAVFAAFRQVEVYVRVLIGAPESLIGAQLMRAAFGEGGQLRVEGADSGELDARSHLFAGAMGVFKNPTSHREVDYSDPTEAAEAVLFADLLLRLVDRVADEVAADRPEVGRILIELHEGDIGAT